LQYYVNKKLGAVKREVGVKSKKKGKLTIQCDEMCPFVGNKDNKQRIWLAIDASTKEMVGVYIGKRDQARAQGLWDYLPAVPESMYRKLYRLLECLGHSFSSKKIQGSRKEDWSDKLYRKI
jgi:IS1 family transposase